MQYDQQMSMEDTSKEYAEFVEKFKPKKTTDDCYTPENVFKAVAEWACGEYGIKAEQIVRPFWPGGDYERFDYPEECVVLDNPPFSILANICRFYNNYGIRFFMFAPALTVSSLCADQRNCAIVTGATVEYENGAKVKTSFVTNMEPDAILRTAPELLASIEKVQVTEKIELPKYEYPKHIISAALVQKWAKVPYRVGKKQGRFIRKIEANDKNIFGGGILLSERAAAERAAAERAAAERAAAERAAAERAAEKETIVWELSASEREIVRQMSEAEEL